jgi:hypothetical protein
MNKTLQSEILKIIIPIWNKEELPGQWNKSTIVPVHSIINSTSIINFVQNLIQYSFLKVKAICKRNYWGSDFLCSSNTEEKWEYNEVLHYQFIDFEKFYDSVRGEVLYNNLITVFKVPIKLDRLNEMHLNDTYSKASLGEHLCTKFLIKNGLKLIATAFQFCFRIRH